jgi:hypothetical protein
MKPEMTIDEFESQLQLHGCTLDKWPHSIQTSASHLLKHSEAAKRLMAEYRHLELALDELGVPTMPDLERRILDAELPEQPLSFLDRAINWLVPRQQDSTQLWRPLAAACLPLFAGVLFGNYFSFGVENESTALNSWEDEFIMLALSEVPLEPAGELQP